MPAISGKIRMEDILDALNLTAVPDGCRLSASDHVDFDDIDVSQSEIDDAASDVEPEQIELSHLAVRDLRDGLRALFEGNVGLARPLLLRALDDHPDAQRSTEEELRRLADRKTFQARVQPWMLACFGPEIAGDREERNHRFLEEAIELVQACGCTRAAAHQLVDYVFGRAVGEPSQEVGGVMVTLAGLCLAHGLDLHADAEVELARIWTKVEAIRAKQARKPAFGPLPGASVA